MQLAIRESTFAVWSTKKTRQNGDVGVQERMCLEQLVVHQAQTIFETDLTVFQISLTLWVISRIT